MGAMMKEMKMGMGKVGVIFLKEGREWRLLGSCMQCVCAESRKKT